MTADIAVIAHRGASEDAPEHTLAAYRQAIAEGADALECDVRLTADQQLVCVHDRRVNRTSNGRGAVSSLELAELAELDFGSWKVSAGDEERPDRAEAEAEPGGRRERSAGTRSDHPGLTGGGGRDPERTTVLTLERLLRLVAETDRPVGLAIETKHPTRWAGQVERRLLELLDRYPVPGEVRVMSFSARSLQRVRAAAPDLPTVYLMHFLLPRYRTGRLPRGTGVAGPSIRVLRRDPGYVARAHEAGHQVHVWTVDDPADVELCARLGVDAVITNRPRTVRDQLRGLA
ncbi:glycerophosphodiester phosphodiesterase [Streptomyces otsuchiensis]|uniref:glycerophosphodiester phosphodiesterase n=1 Tax=Streptomyces otsuchiensis TaxID=2681388 RepID=UPI0010316EAD|nr:glycerophosphodiester phosphodiesterase [Streptomyces otsuchiensis]